METQCGGGGTHGMGRLFPVLSDGCQDIGAGALSPPATPDTAALETWKSLRSMCAGRARLRKRQLFCSQLCPPPQPPAGHFIALQSRPQLTCSVSFSHCHLLRCYSGVPAFLRRWLRHIRLTANGGGKKNSIVHYKCNASWSEQMTDLQSQGVLKVP